MSDDKHIKAKMVGDVVVAEDPEQQGELDSVLDRIRSGKLVMKSFKPGVGAPVELSASHGPVFTSIKKAKTHQWAQRFGGGACTNEGCLAKCGSVPVGDPCPRSEHWWKPRYATSYGVPPYQKLEQCQEPDGDGDGGIHRFQRCPCCEARFDAAPESRVEGLMKLLRKVSVHTWKEYEGRDGYFTNTRCGVCEVHTECTRDVFVHAPGCLATPKPEEGLTTRVIGLEEASEVSGNHCFVGVEVFRDAMPTVNLKHCIGCYEDTLLLLTPSDWAKWIKR